MISKSLDYTSREIDMSNELKISPCYKAIFFYLITENSSVVVPSSVALLFCCICYCASGKLSEIGKKQKTLNLKKYTVRICG